MSIDLDESIERKIAIFYNDREKKQQTFTEIYKKTVGLKYKEKLENLTGLFKMCVNLAKLDEVPERCQKSPPFHLFLCIHRCYATCMSK